MSVNVAEVEPAGMNTLVGTVPKIEFDDNATNTPPAGAGPLRFALTVSKMPPTIVAEPVIERLLRLGTATKNP